jgi:hypothetical protein
MKLSTARAIHRSAQKIPLIKIFDEKGDEFGRSAHVQFEGDHQGFYLQGNAEGTEWWIAHFVYGGAYATGSTKAEAVKNFVNAKMPWVLELAKKRKLAARIVEKYGEGPVVERNENGTYVATLNGEVVGKAANYQAAMKMGERAEKTLVTV